ncbi:Saccharopine dehydrogenase [Dipodascopsis uninucleata]
MSQSVLLLGSGFVAKPTVDILATRPNTTVIVACRTLSKAQNIAGDSPSTKAIVLDVEDEKALDAAVAEHDLVISLIPYTYHAAVVKSGIRNKKNVLTTSYTSPALKELEEECKQAGILVFNEMGLDPGIDHLYAVKTIDEVHKKGGKIIGFYSVCGGLPAPECSDNPLGYKFSWSSRGVLLALQSSAKFWRNGKVVEISGNVLLKTAEPYFIYPGYSFVVYANRNSTIYKEIYKIPEAKNLSRGNLRYQGFTEFAHVLVDLGLFREQKFDFLDEAIPWKEAFAQIIGAPSSTESDLIATIEKNATFKDDEDKTRILNGIKWLGLMSDEPITPKGNPLDTFCATLENLMQYEDGERDFVMLQHKFEIEWADGSKETRTSTLADYGDPKGYSSMAKLVGTPCAVAAARILDGCYSGRTGLLAPFSIDITEPIRKILDEEYHIKLVEKKVF